MPIDTGFRRNGDSNSNGSARTWNFGRHKSWFRDADRPDASPFVSYVNSTVD
jgi:hypothetical protein